MTVLKIATCLCKSIVACTEEGIKSVLDKDVLISHLSSFLILFMSELMNKAPHCVVMAGKVRNSPLVAAVSCSALCSQPR